MTKSKNMKNAVIIGFVALFILVAALPIQADDESLKIAPADTLFYVRINNLDYTLSQTDQFLAGISPVPFPLQMMVRGELAQMLGNPALDGVDTSGSLVIFAAVAGGEQFDESSMSILVPVTDYTLLITSSKNLTQPDPNGISEIQRIGGFVTQIGSFAVIKPPPIYEKILAEKKAFASAGYKSLAAALDQNQISQSAKSPLWFYCNLQQLNKTFGPQILAAFDEMRKQMEQMPAGLQPSIQNPAQIMNAYFDLIKAFLNQSKSLSIAVAPKPDVINAQTNISALPGTQLADLLIDDDTAKTENKLLCYLKDGAMFTATGKISEKFNTLGAKFAIKIFGKDLTEEQKNKIRDYTTKWADVFSGLYAASFHITSEKKPPFTAEVIYEVKDKTNFDEVMKENALLLEDSGIIDFYKNMGLDMSATVNPDVDSYKGFSIDSAKFLIKPADPNSPEAQMIEMMYGEGLETRWALAGDLCVYAVGANADSQIKKLIDEVTAAGPKEVCSEIKAAIALLPNSQDADLLVTFNILRVLKMVPAMMPIPVPMPAMDFDTTSNIVLAADIGEGSLTVDIAVPKQHLMEIMQVLQAAMIQQQQMRLEQVKINTKVKLKTLHSAVLNFKMDTGRYPTEEEGLQALIEQPADIENYQSAGYLEKKELPKDAWANSFIYELFPESGKPFLIRSCGPDGQPYTDDDLLSTDED